MATSQTELKPYLSRLDALGLPAPKTVSPPSEPSSADADQPHDSGALPTTAVSPPYEPAPELDGPAGDHWAGDHLAEGDTPEKQGDGSADATREMVPGPPTQVSSETHSARPVRRGRSRSPLTTARKDLKEAVTPIWRASNNAVNALERAVTENGYPEVAGLILNTPEYFGKLQNSWGDPSARLVALEAVQEALRILCVAKGLKTEAARREPLYAEPIEQSLSRVRAGATQRPGRS